MPARLAPVLALCAFLFALAGCERAPMPQLIQALEFAPREAEVGDRLEVRGSGFPKGKTASLSFRGVLYRPGEDSQRAEVDAQGTVTSAQQIELPFTEALQTLFCGRGDRAAHTTFVGEIEVAFPAVRPGAPPVTATLRGVTVDFRPPLPPRAVFDARVAEGARALSYVGIVVAPDGITAGGVVVREVLPGSRADQAGVLADDLLTSFDHVRLTSLADAIPSGAHGTVVLGIRRGEAPTELTKEVAVDGFTFAAPGDLLGAALILALAAALIVLFLAPRKGIFSFLETRVAARMQRQSFRSIARMLLPAANERAWVRFAPYLVFSVLSAVFAAMPFGRYLIIADLDIAILFLLAILSLLSIGLLSGGLAKNGPGYSFFAGLRAAAQILVYELPAAIAILCVVMMTGSLRMQDIIRAQGGLPWDWYMFRSPVTLVLFFLFMTSILAEGSRATASAAIFQAEVEGAGPPPSAHSTGLRYLVFFVGEWANVFVMSGIATTIFLGGWQVPGIASGEVESRTDLELIGSLLFLLKSWSLTLAVVAVRWSLPPIRIAQMMTLCGKWLVPLALCALVLTSGWVAWSPVAHVQKTLGVAMFAVFCLGLVRFSYRVRYNLRLAYGEAHLNPFL